MDAASGRQTPTNRPLNERQLKFVERYVATGNATQSYIDAGYACNADSAQAAAARLLADVRVQRLVNPPRHPPPQATDSPPHGRADLLRAIEVTRERIRLEMARIAFANPKDLFRPDGTPRGVHELDDDAAAALAQFEVEEVTDLSDKDAPKVVRTSKFKFWDKNRALRSLGDTEAGVWVGKGPDQAGAGTTNVSVTVNAAAVTTITPDDVAAARRLLGVAGGDLPPDGGQEPLGPR